MTPRPGRWAAFLALVPLATSIAWAQRVEVAPVVLPQASVSIGAAPLAAAAAQLAPSVRSALVLPGTLPQARLIDVARPVPVSAVARAAVAFQQNAVFGELAALQAALEGTGASERGRRIRTFYDRSRAPAAQPLAAASGDQGGGGPSGRALLDQVEELAKRGHRGQSYDSAREFMFSMADQVVRGGRKGVLEVYSQTFVPGTSAHGGDYRGNPRDGEWDRDGMNAEHLWPQSFFAKKLPMRSDLHNLLPTFVHPNSLRGHLPFGEVVGRPEYSNRAGGKLGGGVFEPPPAAKGRIARSILYFVARYRDDAVRLGPYGEEFFNERIEMFLRWSREHPPTGEELRRNELVAKFQGNRNPFVDDPSLADRIGVDGFRFDPRRPNRPFPEGNFVRPHFSHEALIHTAGMRPHEEWSRQDRRRGGPAGKYDGRRNKR